MTKELNFNKSDIEAENMAFYEWQEALKPKIIALGMLI